MHTIASIAEPSISTETDISITEPSITKPSPAIAAEFSPHLLGGRPRTSHSLWADREDVKAYLATTPFEAVLGTNARWVDSLFTPRN